MAPAFGGGSGSGGAAGHLNNQVSYPVRSYSVQEQAFGEQKETPLSLLHQLQYHQSLLFHQLGRAARLN